MMLYTLSMSHDDCGGSFEHAHFFHKLQQVLGVPSAKEEIRNSIGDILSFVESEYQEEEKKLRRREIAEQRRDREAQREQERRKRRKKKGWEVAMVAISVAVLPVLMSSGFFGMNLEGIPFWEVVVFTTGMSALLLVVLLAILLIAFRQARGGHEEPSWLFQGMDRVKRSLDLGRRHGDEDEGGRAMAESQPVPGIHPFPRGTSGSRGQEWHGTKRVATPAREKRSIQIGGFLCVLAPTKKNFLCYLASWSKYVFLRASLFFPPPSKSLTRKKKLDPLENKCKISNVKNTPVLLAGHLLWSVGRVSLLSSFLMGSKSGGICHPSLHRNRRLRPPRNGASLPSPAGTR